MIYSFKWWWIFLEWSLSLIFVFMKRLDVLFIFNFIFITIYIFIIYFCFVVYPFRHLIHHIGGNVQCNFPRTMQCWNIGIVILYLNILIGLFYFIFCVFLLYAYRPLTCHIGGNGPLYFSRWFINNIYLIFVNNTPCYIWFFKY